MHRTSLLAVALVSALSSVSVEARTFSGARGGNGSVSYSQQGNRFSAQASGTTAGGKSGSASAATVYHPTTGILDVQGSLTGPQGATHGGAVVAGDGAATVTADDGAVHSYTKPQ